MKSIAAALSRFWRSSIGRKIVVAVTGLLLIGFLLGHVAGNLLVFQGREAMNGYAEFLHEMLHGWGIWIFRIGILAAFVLHIAATISLTIENRAARQDRYEAGGTVQASGSSRIMIWSGLTVVAFVVFHILHFTVRIDPDLADLPDPSHPGRHDVFGMVILGFKNPLVVLFYLVSVSLLCSHLSHGIASLFQTLGLRSARSKKAIQQLGLAVAIALWLGFLSIPLAIVTRVHTDPAMENRDAVSRIESRSFNPN